MGSDTSPFLRMGTIMDSDHVCEKKTSFKYPSKQFVYNKQNITMKFIKYLFKMKSGIFNFSCFNF